MPARKHRIPLAALAGVAGFLAYVAAAASLFDAVAALPWWAHALYFLVAGTAWVPAARWLMYWGAGLR